MSYELIPPPDLAPPSVKHLPIEKRFELWFELLDESEALLISGLKAKVGPHGDWKAAYREWFERRLADHDLMLTRFAANLTHREAGHGG
jgi:hypothetical protein